MRQSSLSPEDWIRHRKLRKKIASAKWYAHKKQREVDDQNQHRIRLEIEAAALAERNRHLTWPDDERRAEWYAVVAHHSWGYPPRPSSHPATHWRTLIETIEGDIDHLREGAGSIDTRWYHWMNRVWIRKIFRQLALREALQTEPWDHPVVPMGCPEPIRWTTSAWNWLWVCTHLGNHRESFSTVWTHLHHRSLTHPTNDPWTLLRDDPHLLHWIRTMSQNLADELAQTELPPPDSQEDVLEYSQTTSDSVHDPWNAYPFVTQPPSPDIEWSIHDSDSESLPESLDNYVTEAFAL